MNYLEYYKAAKLTYDKAPKTPHTDDTSYIENFTCKPLENTPLGNLPQIIGKELDKSPAEGFIKKYKKSIFDLSLGPAIANQLVPNLESHIYGCHLFVDKVYIYRNIYTKNEPASSWLWHYDNNPPTAFKIMIYLTDVLNKEYAPFNYVERHVVKPTRNGPDDWKTAPNGSRVPPEDIKEDAIRMVCGVAGTTFLFYSNCVHRATMPAEGKHRDVLVLRVRPTIEKIPYISPEYTTSWEASGTCPQDPRNRKCKIL